MACLLDRLSQAARSFLCAAGGRGRQVFLFGTGRVVWRSLDLAAAVTPYHLCSTQGTAALDYSLHPRHTPKHPRTHTDVCEKTTTAVTPATPPLAGRWLACGGTPPQHTSRGTPRYRTVPSFPLLHRPPRKKETEPALTLTARPPLSSNKAVDRRTWDLARQQFSRTGCERCAFFLHKSDPSQGVPPVALSRETSYRELLKNPISCTPIFVSSYLFFPSHVHPTVSLSSSVFLSSDKPSQPW